MKSKILNLLLILSSLVGYLEWGKNNHLFLYQAEEEIIGKLFSDPLSVLHPFTILPLIGQLLLLITLFQKQPGKLLTIVGVTGLCILLLFMFIIGLIGVNYKMLFSTGPFLVIAYLTILHLRNEKGIAK